MPITHRKVQEDPNISQKDLKKFISEINLRLVDIDFVNDPNVTWKARSALLDIKQLINEFGNDLFIPNEIVFRKNSDDWVLARMILIIFYIFLFIIHASKLRKIIEDSDLDKRFFPEFHEQPFVKNTKPVKYFELLTIFRRMRDTLKNLNFNSTNNDEMNEMAKSIGSDIQEVINVFGIYNISEQ